MAWQHRGTMPPASTHATQQHILGPPSLPSACWVTPVAAGTTTVLQLSQHQTPAFATQPTVPTQQTPSCCADPATTPCVAVLLQQLTVPSSHPQPLITHPAPTAAAVWAVGERWQRRGAAAGSRHQRGGGLLGGCAHGGPGGAGQPLPGAAGGAAGGGGVCARGGGNRPGQWQPLRHQGERGERGEGEGERGGPRLPCICIPSFEASCIETSHDTPRHW